jgi:zinc finger CCHC domain-containing protein 9
VHPSPSHTLEPLESSHQQVPLGIGEDAQRGADEDDFHIFKRRKAEVEQDEKKEDKALRLSEVKVGAHSGVIKAFGKPAVPSRKRVVYF